MLKKMLTPNELEILIHYYICSEKHPRFDAPAVREAIDMFIGLDVLKRVTNQYYLTRRGKVWLRMILETPCPELIFIDPRTNGEIKEV